MSISENTGVTIKSWLNLQTFLSSMITPLYRDKNNLLGPQLNFKFSATRISPDVTTILMPVRHLDESRQCPFLTQYFFIMEDPHSTYTTSILTRNIRFLLYHPSYNEIYINELPYH